MHRIVFSIVTLLLYLTVNGFSQPVVLLTGKVSNGGSGVKVEIVFKDESGHPVRVSSSSDGSYQTVLKPGHRYDVVVTDDDLTRFKFNYEVPNFEKYTELKKDFVLGVIDPVVKPKQLAVKTKKKTKIKKSTKGK